MAHALLGNGVIVINLAFDHRPNVFQIAGFGKIEHALHGHAGTIRQHIAGAVVHDLAALKQHVAVFLDIDDVGVIIRNAEFGIVFPGAKGEDDIKNLIALGRLDDECVRIQICADFGPLLRRHLADDLQNFGGLSRDNTGGGRRFDALEVVGVGHDDALDVFDDVAADLDGDGVGQCAQQLAGLGRAVCDGDRFGAAHCGHEFFPQNFDIIPVTRIR